MNLVEYKRVTGKVHQALAGIFLVLTITTGSTGVVAHTKRSLRSMSKNSHDADLFLEGLREEISNSSFSSLYDYRPVFSRKAYNMAPDWLAEKMVEILDQEKGGEVNEPS